MVAYGRDMETLIAEDLLLLLLDDDSGALSTSYPEPVLGGALLIELAVLGAVEVEAKKGIWRSAKVHGVPDADVEDPLLRAAYAEVSFRDRSAQDLVGRLGKGARDDLAERLVGRGILELRETKVLGLFPRKRWPAVDTTHEQALRRRLQVVLVDRQPPDDRTGALVALLSAIDKAHKVVDHPGIPARIVRKRGKEVAEGAWAAKAVRDAIQAANTAVTAGTVAAASAATSG